MTRSSMPPPGQPESPPAPRPPRGLGLLGFVVVVAAAVFLVLRAPIDRPMPAQDEEPSATADRSAAAPAPPPPRCQRLPAPGFRLGRAGKAGQGGAAQDEPMSAFGAEVGRAAAIASGFAVGAIRDDADGAMAGVVTLAADGSNPQIHELGRMHGDYDPPLVAPLGAMESGAPTPSGSSWLAAMSEPSAANVAIRLATGDGGHAKWGAEIDRPRSESPEFDVAAGPKAAIAAWSELDDHGKLSRVWWSSLAPDASKRAGKAMPASEAEVDADSPRLCARPDGFWLAYLARKEPEPPPQTEPAPDRGDKHRATGSAAAGAQERYPAEQIEPSWIELMPLDSQGKAAGPARAVTPKDGHVLGFDLDAGAQGAALIAWRDDDTPSGAQGGRVSLMAVTASGGTQTQLVAAENVGAGVPALLGFSGSAGWIAVSDAAGRAMLAPLGEDGAMQGELRLEPAIGPGDALAASGDRLLVALPTGAAVELALIECKR